MTQPASEERSAIAFRLRRRFDARREDVFRAWTDPDVLKQWWCPPGWTPAEFEVDLRSGGAYRLGMQQVKSSGLVTVWGHFLEVRRPELLVYTWHWQNAFEHMPETRVTVEFIDQDGTTEVVLMHENLPEIGVCLRHRAGWLAAWERMEVALLR